MTAAEPVRWGILGTGGISKRLLDGARRSSAVEVVAVGSRTPEQASAYAASHEIPTAHGSYEALLADPRVEAVYISVPNSLHHPTTMRALAAGKHVLCEKPYSSDPKEVDAAFDAAEAGGLTLSEAFMWRHHPQVALLRSVLPELGEVQTIRATFNFLRFPGGIVAEFTCGFTADHRGLEVIGKTGSLRLTDPWQSNPATIVRDGVETRLDDDDPYQLELEDIGRAIRERRPALLGRSDALGQARTIAALRKSAATGRAVPVR